jgi:DNA-binding MarR family transcriptional regulator
MRVIKVVLGPASYLGETQMDAILTGAADLGYSDLPPVLVAASSQAAMARAERTIEASGLRIGGRLPIEHARERIEQQAAATALWLELDSDCGGPMDDLLSQVRRDVADGRYAAVVSTTAALLDPLAARVGDSDVELIVDASDAERAAALAIVTTQKGAALRVSDIGSDKNAERLRQLSDEVSRIASTLARLSSGPATPPPALVPLPAGDVPPVSADTVRSAIRARRLRARYFSEELFADPAWDMLLDLLQAEIAQLRVPVSSLCIAAAVPATTALRWLKTMVSQGIFVRRADPHDGRRVFVELAPETSHALRRYFGEVGRVAVI